MIPATVCFFGVLACVVAAALCHLQATIRDTDKWGKWAMCFAYSAGVLFVATVWLWEVQGA